MGPAVPRLIFAWELGGGQGHIRAFLPVAERLRDAGVDVVCATRDLVAAKPFFDAGFTTIPAPRVLYQLVPGLQAFSYAEILVRAGFGRAECLDALIGSWGALYRHLKPDLVVSDFAPGALLAARVAGVKTATIGIGFPLPPLMSPLPLFRPRTPPPTERVKTNEREVLASLNAALERHGKPPLGTVAEITHTGCDLLATFAELDQYPQRRDGRYIGPIYSTPKNAGVTWPKGEGPRIFAYLEGARPEFPRVVEQMRATGWPTHVVGRVLPPVLASKLTSDTVTVSTENADVEEVLKTAGVVVCHGNYGMVCQSLLAGVPVVGLPTHPENELTCHIIERLRMGVFVGFQAPAPAATNAIHRVATDPGIRKTVAAFAKKHSGYRVDMAVDAAAKIFLEQMKS